MNNEKRYIPVSDGFEYTVYDTQLKSDLFPTTTKNRAYAYKSKCGLETAQMIADALNNLKMEN